MKKLFAVLVALTLVLSMGVMAFAAEWTGDITINSAENVSVNGKTFTAYQILDAEAVDSSNLDKGVIYSIPAGMQSFYDGLCGGEDNVATIDEVTDYISATTTDLQDFAKAALAEMVRQTGAAEFDENGMMTRGVIARHLLLPGYISILTSLRQPGLFLETEVAW